MLLDNKYIQNINNNFIKKLSNILIFSLIIFFKKIIAPIEHIKSAINILNVSDKGIKLIECFK